MVSKKIFKVMSCFCLKYVIHSDYYEDRKKSDFRFSYRSLSKQSGINPGNFIKMLKGERNLTLVAAIKLLHPRGLNKRERDYFQSIYRNLPEINMWNIFCMDSFIGE